MDKHVEVSLSIGTAGETENESDTKKTTALTHYEPLKRRHYEKGADKKRKVIKRG